MCKNMGQPGFDPTLKRPGMGHRLCNSFRMTRFFDPNPHGSNPNPIDPTRLPGIMEINIIYIILYNKIIFMCKQ